MRPNLSLENIALTLTALGTSAVLAACTKAEPAAVKADQSPVNASANASASPSPPPPPPVATASAAAPDAPPETKGTPMAIPTASTPSAAKPRRAPGAGGGGGQASCGAGTCTADPKKK